MRSLMSGSLVSLTPDQQIEVIYIAYFGRAANLSGQTYWSNAYKTMTTPVSEGGYGFMSIGAIVNIANNFALGPEAMALYSFLANPRPYPSRTHRPRQLTRNVRSIPFSPRFTKTCSTERQLRRRGILVNSDFDGSNQRRRRHF